MSYTVLAHDTRGRVLILSTLDLGSDDLPDAINMFWEHEGGLRGIDGSHAVVFERERHHQPFEFEAGTAKLLVDDLPPSLRERALEVRALVDSDGLSEIDARCLLPTELSAGGARTLSDPTLYGDRMAWWQLRGGFYLRGDTGVSSFVDLLGDDPGRRIRYCDCMNGAWGTLPMDQRVALGLRQISPLADTLLPEQVAEAMGVTVEALAKLEADANATLCAAGARLGY